MTAFAYPERKSYGPVGRCIYCEPDARPDHDTLQREHIVPYGLNGNVVLPRASCPSCAKVTGGVESFCLRQMFIEARTHLGLATRGHRRNKKPRPPLRVKHDEPSNPFQRWQELPAEDHPFALMTLDFSPAGLLSGRAPGADPPEIRGCLIPSPGFAERFSKLPLTASTSYKVDTDLYARMLAKIAHSYAVAEYGYVAFDPFLPRIILGKSNDIFHYVSGLRGEALRPRPILHSIEVQERQSLVVALVWLFAFMGAPAYEIAIGRAR